MSKNQPVTRSTTLLLRSLIASIPATTADPASFATSCATRPTRAIGAGTFDDLLGALREDVVAALRFALEALRFADVP